MEGMWCVSKLSRILLKKISHEILSSLFSSAFKVSSLPRTSHAISKRNHLDLVQHQGLNSLKRSQKRLSAAGQKSCSHQGGVGVDAL